MASPAADWQREAFDSARAKGWSVARAARKAKVSEPTAYRWAKESKTKNKSANGLDIRRHDPLVYSKTLGTSDVGTSLTERTPHADLEAKVDALVLDMITRALERYTKR